MPNRVRDASDSESETSDAGRLFDARSPLALDAGDPLARDANPMALPGASARDARLDSAPQQDLVAEAGATSALEAGADTGPSLPASTTYPPHTWHPVRVDGARCRDGTPALFRVNTSPDSDRLVIFLEQGGACVPGACFTVDDDSAGDEGIFDRTHPDNPFRSWHYVYVPYCTGDLHAGDRRDVPVDGTMQQFVGYRNFGLFLEQIGPMFRGVKQVALTGASAGGFGATLNLPRTQDAFEPIEVVLLADSAPLMSGDVLKACQQRTWREAWNLDATVLADCAADCAGQEDWASAFMRHLLRRYPNRSGGVFSNTQDLFIRVLFALGLDDCNPPLIPLVAGADYEAGLLDLRALIRMESPHFGTYFVAGISHICLEDSCLYDTVAAEVPLTTWIRDVLDGTARHVGP